MTILYDEGEYMGLLNAMALNYLEEGKKVGKMEGKKEGILIGEKRGEKNAEELIFSVLKDYKGGMTEEEISKKYKVCLKRVREIVEILK